MGKLNFNFQLKHVKGKHFESQFHWIGQVLIIMIWAETIDCWFILYFNILLTCGGIFYMCYVYSSLNLFSRSKWIHKPMSFKQLYADTQIFFLSFTISGVPILLLVISHTNIWINPNLHTQNWGYFLWLCMLCIFQTSIAVQSKSKGEMVYQWKAKTLRNKKIK